MACGSARTLPRGGRGTTETRLRYEDDWHTPGLTPFTVFCGLQASLERSAQLHELTWDIDALDDPRLGPSFRESMFDRQYVILLHREQPVVMDWRDPHLPAPRPGCTSPGASGGPDRSWGLDLDRAPGQAVGLHARDNAN